MPWGKVDWTDHGRPDAHPDPHFHELQYDPVQKMWKEVKDIKPMPWLP